MEPMEVTEVTCFHPSSRIKEPSGKHEEGRGVEQYFKYYDTHHNIIAHVTPGGPAEPQ